jgi:hypothetical protein
MGIIFAFGLTFAILFLIGVAIYVVFRANIARRNRAFTSDPEIASTNSVSSDQADLQGVVVAAESSSPERRGTFSSFSMISSSSTTAPSISSSSSSSAGHYYPSSSYSSRSDSISISHGRSLSSGIYAQIPIVVKPLSLPRTVELIGSVRPMSEAEKRETLIGKIRGTQDSMKMIPSSTLKCNLIIAVNTSGRRIGGYCINLVDRTAQLYTLKLQNLPWNINEEEDGIEIGMKNFLFALVLWRNEIKKARSIRVYTGHKSIRMSDDDGHETDNCASSSSNSRSSSSCHHEDVKRVRALLKHFQQCERVSIVNQEEIFIPGTFSNSCADGCERDAWNCNYKVDLDGEDIEGLDRDENFVKFVRYIQPAVDLSHWRIKACEKFLTNLYEIGGSNVKKTHCQIVSNSNSI